MPWKKNFDVEEAVESAMQVFWEKGYKATSIADLTEATGVQRQSLYNAIGDKRSLFVRSLLKYDGEKCRTLLASLEARGTPKDSIQALFAAAIEQCKGDELKRGCFLVNTALELQGHDEEVTHLVSSAIEEFRVFFKRLIDHGKVRGEISKALDTDATASGLLAGLMGLRVLARGAVSEAVLQQAADQTLRLIAESPSS